MKNKRIFYTIAIAAFLPGTANAAPSTVCKAPPATAAIKGNDAQRLIAEEAASWTLAIQRNTRAYKAFHAPDFITLTGSGTVARAASEASAMDVQVRFDQCALSGFEVRFVASNAALVTYHVKASGLDHEKDFLLDSYASSLWMKRNGAWLNVFYQATPASKQ